MLLQQFCFAEVKAVTVIKSEWRNEVSDSLHDYWFLGGKEKEEKPLIDWIINQSWVDASFLNAELLSPFFS